MSAQQLQTAKFVLRFVGLFSGLKLRHAQDHRKQTGNVASSQEYHRPVRATKDGELLKVS